MTDTVPASFAALIEQFETRRRTVTVHAPALPDALARLFDTRHIELEHEFLPREAAEPFLTVTEGERYIGSVDLPAVYDFGHPKIHEIGSPDLVDAAYQRLTSLLPDMVFSSLDRRQLLATSREFEDRAWRVGSGRLHVGFQQLSKLRPQADVYTALCDRGLDVHAYGEPDWRPPFTSRLTLHLDGPEIENVWFMAYDGGDNPDQACGLVAEERSPGSFTGVWTYDSETVDLIFQVASRIPPRSESERT